MSSRIAILCFEGQVPEGRVAPFSVGCSYWLMAGRQMQSLHCLVLVVHEILFDDRRGVIESDCVDGWRVG